MVNPRQITCQRDRALWPKITCVMPSRCANGDEALGRPFRLETHDRSAKALGECDVLAQGFGIVGTNLSRAAPAASPHRPRTRAHPTGRQFWRRCE